MGGIRRALQLALGCCAVFHAHAAEYSIAPSVSWTMDYNSNRYLVPGASAGAGSFLTLAGSASRSTPTLNLTLAPILSFQRYTTGSGSNSDNRSVNASAAWTHELSKWMLSGSYSDLSTLITELATTGVVQGNTRQRQESAQGSWQLQQSDYRSLDVEASYSNINYVGLGAVVLSHYQYPTLSIAERFNVRPHTTVSATAFASEVRSTSAGTSRDYNLQLSVEHSFSDRNSMLASFGRSQEIYSTGSSHGYVGQFKLTRSDERNKWALSYQRSVAPTGFGGLVRRDAVSASVSRDLAPHLSGSLAAFENRDREVFRFGSFEQGRRYESFSGNLSWASGETSSIGIRVSTDRAIVSQSFPVPTEKSWQAGLVYTWTPLPSSLSR